MNSDSKVYLKGGYCSNGWAIARLAFEYARANGKKKVTIVTKANIVKTTKLLKVRIFKHII